MYGAISRSGEGFGKAPRATFVLDNTTRTFWEGQQEDRIQRGVQLYSVGGLSYGDHVLTIVNEYDEGRLWLDYFDVVGIEGTATAPKRGGESPPVGAIVGGVVGGVAAIGILALLLFLFKRRQRRLGNADAMIGPTVTPGPEPAFVVYPSADHVQAQPLTCTSSLPFR